MNLNDYSDRVSDDDIRIRGTRVGIETVLYDYLHGSQSPESIASRYPALTLEQVYATITYYLHNEQAARDCLERWLKTAKRRREQQQSDPPSSLERLKQVKSATPASI